MPKSPPPFTPGSWSGSEDRRPERTGSWRRWPRLPDNMRRRSELPRAGEGRPQQAAFPMPKGTRRQQRLLRVLVFGVLGLLLLLGLRDLVGSLVSFPRHAPPTPSASATSVPVSAAEAYAQRVAVAYETYDAGHPEARRQALEPYVGAAAVDDWNGQGSQRAEAAQATSVQGTGSGKAVVTVAVLVDSGNWVWLAVPVKAQGEEVGSSGLPAVVPAATTLQPDIAPAPPDFDGSLSSALVPTVTNFLHAWASGDQSQLTYYSTPGASIRPLTGVRFTGLQSLRVLNGQGDRRQAWAEVVWEDTLTHARITDSYRLNLVDDGGRWLVGGVGPAA